MFECGSHVFKNVIFLKVYQNIILHTTLLQIWNFVTWGQNLSHKDNLQDTIVSSPVIIVLNQSSWNVVSSFVFIKIGHSLKQEN